MFGEIFKQKTNPLKMDDLAVMVRILAEGNEGSLGEILYMALSYAGEGHLSVVSTSSREVIASTREKEEWPQLKNIALRFRDLTKKQMHFREEEGSLLFPDHINYLYLHPLFSEMAGGAFLMMELQRKGNELPPRVLDVITVAARFHLMELTSMKYMRTDALTGLKNRDAFIDRLGQLMEEKEGYMGMLTIAGLPRYADKHGMSVADGLIREVAGYMKGHFKGEVYHFGSGKFAVYREVPLYDMVGCMQDILDAVSVKHPQVDFGCVVTKRTSKLYKMLYLCEQASISEYGDVVMVVRDVDGEFEVPVTEQLYYLGMKKDKEEKKFYEKEEFSREDIPDVYAEEDVITEPEEEEDTILYMGNKNL